MIAYYYTNPAAAHLVDRIDDYPGISSWDDFTANMDKLNAAVAYERPWVRLPTIPELPSRSVSVVQDEHITQILLSRNNKKMHCLEVKLNAWMKCFNITTDAEAAQINARILARLRHHEEVCRRWRIRKGWRVMGKNALYAQPIMAPIHQRSAGEGYFA